MPKRKSERSVFFIEEALEIARELGYGPYVIKRLRLCKTESEVSRVMHDARNGLIGGPKPKKQKLVKQFQRIYDGKRAKKKDMEVVFIERRKTHV